MRLFSIKRIILASILGFLLPLGYAFMLSVASDYTGKTVPDFMVIPFGWPRPVWIFLTGRQPLEFDIIVGLLFMALCNIALYGTLSYAALLIFSVMRNKEVNYEPPPMPKHYPSE